MNNTQPKTMEERFKIFMRSGDMRINFNNLFNFVQQEIHLAEEALREHIRYEIKELNHKRPMEHGYRYDEACQNILSLPSLQINKE